MRQVTWSIESRDDIQSAHDYIARYNPIAAEDLARELFIAGESLADFPYRGRPGTEEGIRELVVNPRYLIMYEVRDDDVHILRVWHTRRDRTR